MICVSPRIHVASTAARRLRQPCFKPRRGLVVAQCSVDGVEFGVVGVHLSLMQWSRPAEAGRVGSTRAAPEDHSCCPAT